MFFKLIDGKGCQGVCWWAFGMNVTGLKREMLPYRD